MQDCQSYLIPILYSETNRTNETSMRFKITHQNTIILARQMYKLIRNIIDNERNCLNSYLVNRFLVNS
jgi:hypothetical protein